MKEILKDMKWDAVLKGVLYILLGITALVIPDTMVRTLGYILAGVLIISGIVSIVAYVLRDAKQNYYRNDFLYGLAGIVLGIVVLLKVELIISLIPMILGILVIISGCSKLQDVIDMKRLGQGNWTLMLVVAIINLIIGLVLVANPFKVVTMLFRVMGMGLIFSGLTDCLTTIYFANKIKGLLRPDDIEGTYEEVKGSD